MSQATHQTVRLARGKHTSPEHGACVMELASMLAGERFSDHPDCVCPVIGGFLREYNDRLDDDRRQDLYAYAARIVGSRAPARTENARVARLGEWAREMRSPGWRERLLPRLFRSIDVGLTPAMEPMGPRAARVIRKHTAESHAAVLALIDDLLAIGEADQSGSTSETLEHEVETSSRA